MSSKVERVLLVEGIDDKHVIQHLCDRHNVDQNFEIKEKSGFDPLSKSIEGEVKASGRLALGILADGDARPSERWQAIADKLKDSNVDVPSRPQKGGTVVPGRPRVGVWLMPDNKKSGELEDFVETLIPKEGSNLAARCSLY